MKKKVTILIIIAIVVITFIPVYGYVYYKLVKVDYPIYVNGNKLGSDLPTLNYNGNTYLPLRKVAEAANSNVDWDDKKREVIINKDDTDVNRLIVLADALNFYKQLLDVFDRIDVFGGGLDAISSGIKLGSSKTPDTIKDDKEYMDSTFNILSILENKYKEDSYLYNICNVDISNVDEIIDLLRKTMYGQKQALDYLESYYYWNDANDFNNYINTCMKIMPDFYYAIDKCEKSYDSVYDIIINYN